MTAANTSTTAFSVADLVKTYPGFQLGPVNLELIAGQVLALVGANGAGKTTLLNCMVGLCRADTGSVQIFGTKNRPDTTNWKQTIGYVGERSGFYQKWTGQANLDFLGGFYTHWSPAKCTDLANRLNLPLNKPVKDLSTGNRAKLALVAALGHTPQLLLLDEPFSGLDPLVRAEVHDILWQYLEDGMPAIMYSTHILSDVSRLADEMAFIGDGQVLLRAPTCDLSESWRRISFRSETPVDTLPAAFNLQRNGNDYKLLSSDAATTQARLNELAAQDIIVTRLTLEEIAVQIMRGSNHVASA